MAEDKTNIKRKLQDAAWFCVSLVIVYYAYGFYLPSYEGSVFLESIIPEQAITYIILGLLVWSGAAVYSDDSRFIPRFPDGLLFGAVIGGFSLLFGDYMLGTISILGPQAEFVIWSFISVFLFFVFDLFIAIITASILGVDTSEKTDATDDPFGDKHAEKILDESE